MKKFYMFLLAVGIVFSVQAQRVKFYYEGAELTKGSTLDYSKVDFDGFSYLVKPDVKLQASSNSQIMVKVECTTGQNVGLCFGGECLSPSTVLTSKMFQMAANTYYDLEYDYEAFEPITTEVISNISVIDYVTDASINNITIAFRPGSGNVSIVGNDDELAYRNGVITYNVAEAAPFTLTTIQGQNVIDTKISGKGSFDTAGLAKGIYVYRLGKTSGKLLVK